MHCSSRTQAVPTPPGGITWGRRRAASALLAGVVAVAGLAGAPPSALAAYSPATDLYSMAKIAAATGATAWWSAGYTGAGVGVAVIDTGVAPVAGLNGTGKLYHGPDLSLESQNPAFRYLDTNGHGTFMAGLIGANSTAYKGIAPGAKIVSLKVGTADGGTDVSQVIAAINWVIQHRNDNGLNIRVISLSYGTNSTQAYTVDPLSYAVEQAWKKGIVVVAAAGNTGYQRGSGAPGLATPANDPYVIAVGGSDTMGTTDLGDDTIGSYSASSAGCGSDCKKPDFVAPGSHVQGLRVPKSWLDLNHPEGYLNASYFRGSGSSQSTAIVAGAVALVLQKFPSLTPDQVKRYFRDNAEKLGGVDSQAQGAGQIRLATMLTKTAGSLTQSFTNSTGTGSLHASRGTDRVTDDGVVLTGEKDIFGKPWNAAAMAAAMAAGSSWSGGTWNGSSWTGSSWSGSSWSGSSWSGSSWSGSSWSGNSWSGNSWSGSSWSGSSWSGSSWSGSSWSGNSWSTGSWD